MKRFFGKALLCFVLLLAILIGFAFIGPLGVSEATGCSREENRRATSDACRPAVGQTCYYCEYSYGGGYSVCYENEEGSVKFCTDFQIL